MSDAVSTATQVANSIPPSTVDALKQALVDIINGTVKNAGEAKDFIIGQAPDVVKQLVIYYQLYYGFIIVVNFVLAIVLVIAFFKYFLPMFRSGGNDEAFGFMGSFAAGLGSISCLAVSLCHVPQFLMATFAPKIFILSFASKLIHGTINL